MAIMKPAVLSMFAAVLLVQPGFGSMEARREEATWPNGKSPSCDDAGVAGWCIWCNDMVELAPGAEKVKNPYSGTAQWMTPTGELDVHVCEGAGQKTCLPIAVRCDGEPDCPNGDDEQFCNHHAADVRQRRETSGSGSGSVEPVPATATTTIVAFASIGLPGVASCVEATDEEIQAVGTQVVVAAVALPGLTGSTTLSNSITTCVEAAEPDARKRRAEGDVTIEVEMWFSVDADDADGFAAALAEAEAAIGALMEDLENELEITVTIGGKTITAGISEWVTATVTAEELEAQLKAGGGSLLGDAVFTYTSGGTGTAQCDCDSDSGKSKKSKSKKSKSSKSSSSDDAEAKMGDVGEAKMEESSSSSKKSKKSKSKSSKSSSSSSSAEMKEQQPIICADDGAYMVILDPAASQIYMAADQSLLSNMNEHTTPFAEVRLDLSAECQRQTIYKSFFLGYADLGHPPVDPIGGGGWGVPHFDAHFNTKDAATIAGYTCKAGPVPVQCNQDCTTETCGTEAMDQLAKMNNLPAAEYITGFIVDASWGGHAIIGHGLHLVPAGDASFVVSADPAFPGFDANCAGGPDCGNPSWVGCAAVTEGAADIGCRYSKASLTSIAITYDGERIGEEAMFTKEQVASMSDGQSVTIPYPQAESVPADQAGKLRALTTRIDVVGSMARIGFDLIGPIPEEDDAQNKKQKSSKLSKSKSSKKSSKSSDSSDSAESKMGGDDSECACASGKKSKTSKSKKKGPSKSHTHFKEASDDAEDAGDTPSKKSKKSKKSSSVDVEKKDKVEDTEEIEEETVKSSKSKKAKKAKTSKSESSAKALGNTFAAAESSKPVDTTSFLLIGMVAAIAVNVIVMGRRHSANTAETAPLLPAKSVESRVRCEPYGRGVVDPNFVIV